MDAPPLTLGCLGACGRPRPHAPADAAGRLWRCQGCGQLRRAGAWDAAPATGDAWLECEGCHAHAAHEPLPLPGQREATALACRGCGLAHRTRPQHLLLGMRATACGLDAGGRRCAADPAPVRCPACVRALLDGGPALAARGGPSREAWFWCCRPGAHEGLLLAEGRSLAHACQECAPEAVWHYLEPRADCPACTPAWACQAHFVGLCALPLSGRAHSRDPLEVACPGCVRALVESRGELVLPDWRPAEGLPEDFYGA